MLKLSGAPWAGVVSPLNSVDGVHTEVIGATALPTGVSTPKKAWYV